MFAKIVWVDFVRLTAFPFSGGGSMAWSVAADSYKLAFWACGFDLSFSKSCYMVDIHTASVT